MALPRCQYDCLIIANRHYAFIDRICSVGKPSVKEMAESKRHYIRILLTKFSEILLNPRIRIKIVQLKHLRILQMIELRLQKLSQSSHSLLMDCLIHQFSEDQPMDVGSMHEFKAHPA